MYYALALCITIAIIFISIMYIALRRQEKLGKYENETKQWREHAKILETMRKAHDEVDAMPMDDIIDIVRRHEKP